MTRRLIIGSCFFLLLSVVSANQLDKSETEWKCTSYKGWQQCYKYFKSTPGHVEPNIYIQLLPDVTVQENLLGGDFYFEVPLKIDKATKETFYLMEQTTVTGFEVKLMSVCSMCEKIYVVGVWSWESSSEVISAVVRISCGTQRHLCQKLLMSLRFTGSSANQLGESLQLRLNGRIEKSSDMREFTLTRTGVPVLNAVENKQLMSNVFWFEENKILLYSIAANSGYEAAATFLHGKNTSLHHHMTIGGRLPTLFRSSLIDSMAQLFNTTGMRFIVAEMRAEGRMVAQVVFDISSRPSELNKENWFNKDRVVSSHPYPVGNTFNHFSIRGDIREDLKRSFLISFEYADPHCRGDRPFFLVAEIRDTCPWANMNWGGLSPSMMYTSKRGLGDATGQYDANQFLVYLM